MSKNKKIIVGILIVPLIIVIGAVAAYKLVEDNVTDRAKLDSTAADSNSNTIGTEIHEKNEKNDANSNMPNTTFIRTYNILDADDSSDENYLYLTIKQYQEEEVETVKVQKSLAHIVEKENNYEFTFQYTDNIVEDNIESIFANTILISIKKTDKQGLEQTQDSIRYYKDNLSGMEGSYSGKFPKGITIYAGEEVSENLDETFGYNFEVLTDKETIKNAKEQLEKVLNKYPKGFWDELLSGKKCGRESLVICLVGELSNSNEVYSNPTGTSTYDSDTYYVFVDSAYAGPDGANIEGTIFHELMHVIDFYLQDIGEQYSDWENYLPDDFEYTEYTNYHFDKDFSMCMFHAADDNDVWFDGIYATESILEDRACMMSFNVR